jgi:quinol monooxygenase YgiN
MKPASSDLRGYASASVSTSIDEENAMSEVAVVAIFVAKPGKEEELKHVLEANVEPTRKERGALQYDLHRDIEEPRRFIFVERWESEAALTEHGKSAHIQAFRAKAPDLCEHGEVRVATKIL